MQLTHLLLRDKQKNWVIFNVSATTFTKENSFIKQNLSLGHIFLCTQNNLSFLDDFKQQSKYPIKS